jgi:hypothetical protein
MLCLALLFDILQLDKKVKMGKTMKKKTKREGINKAKHSMNPGVHSFYSRKNDYE